MAVFIQHEVACQKLMAHADLSILYYVLTAMGIPLNHVNPVRLTRCPVNMKLLWKHINL